MDQHHPKKRLNETVLNVDDDDDEEDQRGSAAMEETKSIMQAVSKKYEYIVMEVDHQSSSDFSESSMDDNNKDTTKIMQEKDYVGGNNRGGKSQGSGNQPKNIHPLAVPTGAGSLDHEMKWGGRVLLDAVPVDEQSEEHHGPPTIQEVATAVPISQEEDGSPRGIWLIFRNRQVACMVVALVIVSVSLAAGLIVSDGNNKKSDNKEAPSDTTPPSAPPTALYWTEIDSFDELDGQTEGGYRLSMSGDGTVLAGSPRSRGIARFFEKKDGRWTENVNLRLNRTDNDSLGHDVSLSNDGKRVALGSNGYNAYNTSDGKVEIYELDDSTGTWKTPQVIYGDMDLEESGYSVALSKDGLTLAIGVPFRTYNTTELYALGHVRVYRWDAETSSFQQVYGVDGEEYCDFAGGSVALSGDGSVLAIGSPSTCTNRTGKVRVFYYEEGTGNWKQRGKTIYDESSSTWFGFSIDLSDDGNYLAVGAVKGLHVKVFQWKYGNEDEDEEWEQVGQTLKGDVFDFGVTVSLSIQSSSSPSCPDSAILATNDHNDVYTYRLLGNDDDQWEVTSVFPGAEVSLSSDGRRTIGVVERFDPGFAVYDELETESCG